MTTVTLGRTGITANKNAFGALPIQRVEKKEAVYILQKAFYNGINFFDSARGYTDSEEKIGMAFEHVRDRLFISTKTHAKNVETFWKDLETSLKTLRTDYIDIYQFHNPDQAYLPGDGTGMYEAMVEAKKQGKIRFIGITNHRETIARKAIESGCYDNLQFPFSYLATDLDIGLVKSCKELDVGFLAMKGMSGGLITNSAAAYAYMSQYDNVLPIWGVQRESELDEWISYNTSPPALDDAMRAVIEQDRKELIGNFCRLRLLHALPRRHPDQFRRAHDVHAAPPALQALHHARRAGRYGEDHRLPALLFLREPLPVQARHLGAFGGQSEGLPRIRQGARRRSRRIKKIFREK